MSLNSRLNAFLLLSGFLSGCGFAQSLRKDAYGQEDADRTLGRDHGKSMARKGDKIPLPVTVMDQQVTQFSGDPVDLSGIRAKKGHISRTDFDAVANRNENSLWKEDGQQNYFFSTNKAKMPGDLVTIEASKDLRNDILAEFRKILPEDELEAGAVVAGLGTVSAPRAENKPVATSAVAKADGGADAATKEAGAAPPVAPVAATPSRAPASAEDEAPLNIVAEVVNRYPNGNVLLRGIKRFAHNGRNYSVEVTGIARGNDISEEDRVSSSKFFEYKTEMFR